MSRLLGLVLEEGDEVVAVLGLLEATEGPLGARNVLLGVLEVLELGEGQYHKHNSVAICLGSVVSYKSVLVPLDTLLLVGVGVCVAIDSTGVAAEKTVKVGADLVALTLLQVVALCAAGLIYVRRCDL